MSDDLTEIIGTLRAKRADHLRSVSILDDAIAALTRLTGDTSTHSVNSADRGEGSDHLAVTPRAPVSTHKPRPRSRGAQDGVPGACLALLQEAPHAWTAKQIVKEYENRGTPLDVFSPINSVFSALSRLTKRGQIIRVMAGHYAAPEFADHFKGAPKNSGARPNVDGEPGEVDSGGLLRAKERADALELISVLSTITEAEKSGAAMT